MCVHLFGGSSSPSCCNFALRQTSIDGEKQFGLETAKALMKKFYVDDLLKSKTGVQASIEFIENVIKICSSGGFNLTKFTCNNLEVLSKIPDKDRRNGVKNCDLLSNQLPSDRALGVTWCVDSDSFKFAINLKNSISSTQSQTDITRRTILSAISKIYDPLGLTAPFLLTGKRILQRLCHLQLGWDDVISREIKKEWDLWVSSILSLSDVSISRCVKPKNFGETREISLHHFSDASDVGYGQCSYVRFVNEDGQIHCCLLMGKSRVNPMKSRLSMPRLELIAAALSAKIGDALKKEIEFEIDYEMYWTDSKVVLGYIQNDTKRFKLFVTNRVSFIKQRTSADQWFYVDTKSNPADYASRGLNSNKFSQSSCWFNGPYFLWSYLDRNQLVSSFSVNENDPEVQHQKQVFSIVANDDVITHLENRMSSWRKIIRVIAYIKRFMSRSQVSKPKLRSHKPEVRPLNVSELEEAKTSLFFMLQRKYLKESFDQIDKNGQVNKSNHLSPLDPFVDDNGLLRVGGRLQNSSMEYQLKHPVIVPKSSAVAVLIIQWCHGLTYHGGRGLTINEIRDHGIWIVNINSLVRSVIWKCVTCRRLRGRFGVQKMSNLPVDRIEESPPFTYCGLDLFGPFYITAFTT